MLEAATPTCDEIIFPTLRPRVPVHSIGVYREVNVCRSHTGVRTLSTV